MTASKKPITLFVCLLLSTAAFCQMEVTHLFSKGMSATGFGAFLHVGVPLANKDEVTGELGFQYFSTSGRNVLTLPLLVGFRHYINRKGSGIYAEPVFGYSFGASDIPKTDANGGYIYDEGGHEVDVKISGATAGITAGYQFPKFPLNLGLRYLRMFVSGDPSQNILSFRATYALAFSRKLK